MKTGEPKKYWVVFRSFEGFNQKYQLSKTSMTVGSQVDADICYPGLEIGHAKIKFDNGAWVISRQHPDADLFFRGYPFVIKKLNPGDQISLGVGILTYLGDDSEKITAVTEINELSESLYPFYFTLLNGPQKGRKISLSVGEYIVGRLDHFEQTSTNARRIELHHRYISRNHARIFVESNRLIIEDLQSTNGTRINGKKIQKAQLAPGDILKLGKLKIKISGHSRQPGDSIPTIPVRLSDTNSVTIFFRVAVFVLAIMILLVLWLFVYR
ncbi:MAG: FHA domain-containing protein [bacterium]